MAWILVTTILHLFIVALVQLIENVVKWGLILDHVQEVWENSAVLKIAAQAFEAGDFLDIFLRFWGVLRLLFL